MATSAGEIEVKISADAAKLKTGFDSAKSAVGKFGSTAGEAVAAFGKIVAGVGAVIVGFGAKAVQAYGEQEKAVASLNQALANQGRFSLETSKDLQEYASALQKVTTFGDETIIATEAQLAAFGLEGEELKKTTKATLDLAAAKGIDLRSAADLLGKAFVGETGTLSRYGIIVEQGIPKTEKFAQALGKVNQMFGGQAEAQAQTFSGQITQLGNAFSDLQEEIGALIASEGVGLLSMLKGFTEKVGEGVTQIREFSGEFKSFGDFISANFILVVAALGDTLLSVVDKFVSILAHIPLISTQMATLRESIAATRLEWENQAIQTQANLMQTDEYTAKLLSDEEKKKRAMAATAQFETANRAAKKAALDKQAAEDAARLEGMAKTEQGIRDAIELHHSEALVARAKAIDEFFGFQDGVWNTFFKSAQQLIQQTFDNFGKAMADVIVDSQSFSEALKGVWKSLIKTLISEIVSLIAKLIVALALKSALGLGGASVASAASNITALQGITKKAATGGVISEPSIVTGLRSGKQMIAGEAGSEAIVPMGGGNKTAAEMGMDFSGGGGGGVTINITGTFIEGNETHWQKMFRQKILPEIRRATMSNPTGNFIRKRGATA